MGALRKLAAGLGLIVLAWAAFAQAPEQTIFGPKLVNHPSQVPTFEVDTFALPAGVAGPFKLKVQNGEANGSNRIDSAWVFLNGAQVAGPHDFDPKVHTFERTVQVRPNNLLVVIIAGKANTHLRLSVTGRRILPVPTALAPNPLTITAGASGALTATLSPVPTAAGALAVASANTAVASVPASVAFAAGQAQVTIPVNGFAAGSTTISASANGGSASATVNVRPALPTLTSMTPGALTVAQGANGSLTVTISAAQPGDTHVDVVSSAPSIVDAPSAVTVPAGQISTAIQARGVAPGSARITASLNGSSASSQVTVTPTGATAVSLLPTVSTVTLGASTTLTLTISAAQGTDTVVPVEAAPAGIVQVPTQVTVVAGQTTALVPVTTVEYGQATVTALLNGSSASAGVNVVPPPVSVSTLEPATFTMSAGATGTFTIRINAAQVTNTEIALSVDQPSVLEVPASVTVAQGATSATFTASGRAVGDALITAAVNGTQRTASVHVSPQPAAIASLLPNPLPLQQGATGSLAVSINVAQETDLTVLLANTVPAVATVPPNVTIPAGALSASVPVSATSPGSTSVTASVNGTSATSTVTVTLPPPVVVSLAPATLALPKGTPGTLRVTVSRAPNTATAVALNSSAPAVAGVPSEVNIPQGALFADIPVLANAEGEAMITATLNGGSATASVTIAPAELAALTLSPQAPTNYVGETVPFSATGTMTDGSVQDFTARATWTSSSPAVATIAAGGIATPLAAGETTITASFAFTAVQTGQPLNITQYTVLTVKQPTGLSLAAAASTLVVGQSTAITVTSTDPAPVDGLLVTLTGSTGGGSFPPAVVIPAGGTQATFSFTATAEGSVTVTATAPNRLPGSVTLTIVPPLTINFLSPSSGPIGTIVTLGGTGFHPVPVNNTVTFRGVNNSLVQATALTSTGLQLTVRVPPLAESGPITVSNVFGTASSPPFTVAREQDFQLSISPASVTVYQAAAGSAAVQLSSTGTKAFTGLAALAAQGLPSGVTTSFAPGASLSYLQAGAITFSATAAAAPGTYPITIRGDTKEGGQTLSRFAQFTLNVLPSAGVTGVKGRFVNPAGAGIAGVIVRAEIPSQPQTVTDSAGSFTLTGLPAGTITLRFDATPAHPLNPMWPQNVTVTAGRVLVMEDWTINPPPAADKFVEFAPNSPVEQIIRDARFPGLQIKIPAGTSIVGWDGVPRTRMAIERLDPDKLPVAPPPIKTKSVYQLYFGTPMGGMPNPGTNVIPVTLPNDLGLEPGTKTPLYYYDGAPTGGAGEWKQGGMGTVSADGKVIVSDPGAGIPRFCGVCGLPCFKAAEDEAPNPPCCDGSKQKAGQPVTLATGQELESAVDLVVDGEVPIVISRSFNPFDAFAFIANYQQSLGVNWTFSYDIAMLPFDGDFTARIVLPGNARVDFFRDADGKFRQAGHGSFDGAEIVKVGGSNPTAGPPLAGGGNPPTGPGLLAPTCSPNGTYLLRFRDGREWRFEAAPNATKVRLNGGCLYFVSEMRDAQGRFLTINRVDGKIQSITTSSGGSATFTYSDGVVQSVTDHTGRSVTYHHVSVDAKGGFRALGATTGGPKPATEAAALALGLIPIPPKRLDRATTPEGTYAYTYEDDPPSLRLGGLSFTDGTGGGISSENPSCVNVRGGARLKTIQIPGIPGVFTNYYGPSKRVLRQTWPDGTEIFFKYKVVGGCVPGVASLGAQPSEGAPLNVGSTTSTCQGAGCVRVDSWEGDAVTGGVIVGTEVLDSRGKPYSVAFNSTGLATTETDESGQVVKVGRDPQHPNRVRTRTDALGRTTTSDYDSRGNLTKIVDPAGRETAITYDTALNKPTTIKRLLADGTPIVYEYTWGSPTGVLVSSKDPEGNVTNYRYNAQNRLSLIRDPLGRETAIGYDARGNPNAISDALGNTIVMVSDSAGRVTQTSDALGHSTQASYNSLNQLTSITDAKEGVTRFNFDGRNNLASILNTLNNTIESYGYDTVGRLATKTDAKLKSEVYGYDGNGNLTSIVDRRNQTTTIAYNERNQPERITFHDGTAQVRAYDTVGRLTEISEGDNGQRIEYDVLNRAVKVVTDTLAGQTSVTYQYDDLDRRTKRTVAYPGGVLEETAYAYDRASRLLSISQTGVNVTQTTTYTWDAASRLTRKVLPNAIRQEFAYDDANRLLSITYRRTDDSVIEQVTYAYDANGQRISKGVSAAQPGDSLLSAEYDEANRMTAITLYPGTAQPKAFTLTYDDHGNLIRKENAADSSERALYIWDARNRLATIVMEEGGSTSTAAFKYDALGRRVERTLSAGATFQRTQYVYDGLQAIGELADGRLAAITLTGLNIDEVIARTVNASGGQNPTATKTYLTDALGSVLAMANQAQNPEIFYAYSAYGETSQLGADPDSPTNSNKYTAREDDGLVGGTNDGSLYYYRARYYDPVLKRFISQDPIGLQGGSNVYAYVNGDPVGLTDPLGLITTVDAACMQDPQFCAEIMGQMVENLSSISQGCVTEDAERVSGTIRNIGTLLAVGSVVKMVKGLKPFQVGRASDLQRGSKVGDDLAVHHVGQQHAMAQVVPGYNPKAAPAIAVPTAQHQAIPNITGAYAGSARDLVARDIRNLRNYTDAPNSSLREVIQLNKQMYPGSFAK